MSKKREQRTRAEILATRQNLRLDVEFRRIQVQPVESRSKYTPHFGAKQQAKLERKRFFHEELPRMLEAVGAATAA